MVEAMEVVMEDVEEVVVGDMEGQSVAEYVDKMIFLLSGDHHCLVSVMG